MSMNTLPEKLKDYIELAKTKLNFYELDESDQYDTILRIMLSAACLYDQDGIKFKKH